MNSSSFSKSNSTKNEEEKDEDDIEVEDVEDELETFQMEKLDVRVPVDVWVSMGEPFIPLDGEFVKIYLIG